MHWVRLRRSCRMRDTLCVLCENRGSFAWMGVGHVQGWMLRVQRSALVPPGKHRSVSAYRSEVA